MGDNESRNASQQLQGEHDSSEPSGDDEIDMTALVAAVERLLRRDLELERERLRGAERGDMW